MAPLDAELLAAARALEPARAHLTRHRRAARAARPHIADIAEQRLDLLLVGRLESLPAVGRPRRRAGRSAAVAIAAAAREERREQRQRRCPARRYLRYFRGLRPYIITTARSRNFDMRGLYGNMWGSFFCPMRVTRIDCVLQYFWMPFAL